MAVSRQQAYVGEQLILKMGFTSNTGSPVIPSEISQVVIKDPISGVVLETITSVTNDGAGVYSITTSATWNTVARTVQDVWYYKASSAGITRQALGQTLIASSSGAIPGVILSVQDLLAIPTGVDISSYTNDQLSFWVEIAQTMAEEYTGRKFGQGTYTDRGETVVDRTGRVVLTTKACPIDTVTSVDIWVPGTQRIGLQVQYMDIYKDKGYMYYNTQQSIGTAMHSAYPSVVLTRADKVSYEIVYNTSAIIPAVIKQALAIIVGNLAKKNKLMQETGVSGITGSIGSFKSGDYSVNFTGNENRSGYKPQGRGTDDLITPDVMEILQKYKFMKQNLY